MKEIVWKGKVIRYSGYRIEKDMVIIEYGSHSIMIPKKEFDKLPKRVV